MACLNYGCKHNPITGRRIYPQNFSWCLGNCDRFGFLKLNNDTFLSLENITICYQLHRFDFDFVLKQTSQLSSCSWLKILNALLFTSFFFFNILRAPVIHPSVGSRLEMSSVLLFISWVESSVLLFISYIDLAGRPASTQSTRLQILSVRFHPSNNEQ